MPWHTAAALHPHPSIPAHDSGALAGAAFDPERGRTLGEEIGAVAAGELIALFLGDAAERLAEMRRLVAEGSRKPLERAAHSLKSSAGTFGFERFAAYARAIESAAASAPEAHLLALVEGSAGALSEGAGLWRATRPG